MSADWQGPVNQLLYSLTYSAEIDEEMVHFNADSAVTYTTLDLGPEVYHRAIEQALASGAGLDESSFLPQFDQEQIRVFLRGVSSRLDELRPWPEPLLRPLHPDAWNEFSAARRIARLDASVVEVMSFLQKGFSPIGDARPGVQVMMLQLRTGEAVALVGSYGLNEKVVLLTDAAGEAAQIVEHFVSATGFPAEKISAI